MSRGPGVQCAEIVMLLEYQSATATYLAAGLHEVYGRGAPSPTRQRSVRRSLALLLKLGFIVEDTGLRRPGRGPVYAYTGAGLEWAYYRFAVMDRLYVDD